MRATRCDGRSWSCSPEHRCTWYHAPPRLGAQGAAVAFLTPVPKSSASNNYGIYLLHLSGPGQREETSHVQDHILLLYRRLQRTEHGVRYKHRIIPLLENNALIDSGTEPGTITTTESSGFVVLHCIVLYCIVLYFILGVFTAAQCTATFSDLLCSPNLGITRTWICRLNFTQGPIFSGLRFFNEPEISDSVPPA